MIVRLPETTALFGGEVIETVGAVGSNTGALSGVFMSLWTSAWGCARL